MQGMKKLKKTNKQDYWMIRVPCFPPKKREALHSIATSKRMSTSAYIGNLLEGEIQKAKEASYGNEDS